MHSGRTHHLKVKGLSQAAAVDKGRENMSKMKKNGRVLN